MSELIYLPFTASLGRLKRTRAKFAGQLTEEKLKNDDTMFVNTNTVFVVDTGELWQKTPDGDIIQYRGREYPYKLQMVEGQVIQHLDSYLVAGETCIYEFRNCIPMYIKTKKD